MPDTPLEFVDETEEPHLHGTTSQGRLTGWEDVVFLVGESDDEPTPGSGGSKQGG